MKSIWNKFTKNQQSQILILLTASMLGVYFFWFSGIGSENTELNQLISRRINRIETRSTELPQARNAPLTAGQTQELEDSITQNQRNLRRLQQRFVPLDDQQQRQVLRRELSELASGLGMRVISLDSSVRRSDPDAAPDLNEVSDIDRYYGRPLLTFDAWGNYFALQTLLDDLNSLSYTIAPVNINLQADESSLSARQAIENQQILRIRLVLAI